MAKGGGSIHIERPAEEVFAFVADAENNPRWRSYVIETTWLDDGPSVSAVGAGRSRRCSGAPWPWWPRSPNGIPRGM